MTLKTIRFYKIKLLSKIPELLYTSSCFSLYKMQIIDGSINIKIILFTVKHWLETLLSRCFLISYKLIYTLSYKISHEFICTVLQSYAIELGCVRRIFQTLLNAFYRPCFEVMGYCFYNIRITKGHE